MNDKENPQFENMEGGEPTPEEADQEEQWTEADEASLEKQRQIAATRDNKDLKELRQELDLPTEGPDVEKPRTVKDVLEKNETVSPESSAEKETPEQRLARAIESGDERFIDHASYTIFKAARASQDWATAIEMIKHAKPGDARNGRIEVLKKEMAAAGQTYNGPGAENISPKNESSAEKETPEQRLARAIESGDARRIDHTSRTVFKAARASQDWATAKRMIALAKDESGKRGREEVLKKEMQAAGVDYDSI